MRQSIMLHVPFKGTVYGNSFCQTHTFLYYKLLYLKVRYNMKFVRPLKW